MTPKVLTPEQIEHFIQRGWVKVKEAFPREQGVKVQDFLWGKLAERGILKDDRETWTQPMAFIAENYNESPFGECATQRLADACADLVGDGRWVAQHETGWWGWWPVNFSIGADEVWDIPAGEWHFDGMDERMDVDMPDQGLLVLCLFSESRPHGGGTLILEGSHQLAARSMQANPGLPKLAAIAATIDRHPYLRALCRREGEEAEATEPEQAQNLDAPTRRVERFMNQTTLDESGAELRVVEVTGEPGDVILAHPLMFHAPSSNHAGRPRFMCNRKTPLYEALQFNRADGDYSPLEESMRRALNIEAVTA